MSDTVMCGIRVYVRGPEDTQPIPTEEAPPFQFLPNLSRELPGGRCNMRSGFKQVIRDLKPIPGTEYIFVTESNAYHYRVVALQPPIEVQRV